MKISKPDILAILIISIAVVAYFFPVVYPAPQFIVSPDFGLSDAFHSGISGRYFLAEQLKQHALPLWSNLVGSGFPMMAEGQIGALFLPNVVLYLLFDFPIAHNLTLIVAVLTLGFGMYAWIRLLTKDAIVSLYAAITACFSGIVITQLVHPMHLQGLTLMPALFAAFHLLAHKPSLRVSLCFAFLMGQQLLVGFPQSTFITCLFLIGYWLLLFRTLTIRFILLTLLAVALAVSIALPQLAASYEFLQQTTDPSGFSSDRASYFSFPWKHLITYIDPFLLGNPRFGTYPHFEDIDGSIFWENTGFIGIAPLLFGALAFLPLFRSKGLSRRITLTLATVLCFSVLLMIGKHGPLYFFYEIWPFTLFRVPSRFIWIVTWAGIAISALGLSYIRTHARSTSARFLLIGICIVHIVQLIVTWHGYHAIIPATTMLSKPEILTYIQPKGYLYTHGAEGLHNSAFLQSGWQDFEPFLYHKNTVFPNSNILWNIPTHWTYAGRTLRRHLFADSILQSSFFGSDNALVLNKLGQKLLSLYSIDTLITTTPLQGWQATEIPTSAPKSPPLYLYTNPQALPLVYFATQTMRATTFQEAQKKVASESFVIGKTALVESDITLNESEEGNVTILSRTDTALRISASSLTTDRVLVINQTYYPGWNATIDSKKVTLFPVNLMFTGLVVPPGDHTIELRYTPSFMATTLSAQMLGYLIVGIVGFLPFFSARRTER